MVEWKTKRDLFNIILSEICEELGYNIEILSKGWLASITYSDKNRFIFGYRFPLNSGSSAAICKDKVATTEVLNHFKIPCLQHTLFHTHEGYGNEGNWEKMIKYFKDNQKSIVVKPNDGSNGTNVFLVNTIYDLETAVYQIFKQNTTLCFSPFISIKKEYRVIVLKNKVKLIYSKNIPFLVGNGKQNVFELLSTMNIEILPFMLEYLLKKEITLDYIPSENEIIYINWKHNVSTGAAVTTNIEENSRKKLESIALQVVKAINLGFVSVDIVETEDNNFSVLEVNSGVTITGFASKGNKEYAIAKKLYKEVLQSMF